MKLSRIIRLSVVVIIAATDRSFAQSFYNSPNDTIHVVGAWEDLETLSIQQFNISSKAITLKWKKVSEEVPLNWEASVCDNQMCNTSLVDSGLMNPISPSGFGMLLLHITAHANYGTATVRYAVWDITDSSTKDTLTYILTVNATAGFDEKASNNTLSIFPNPVEENLSIFSTLQANFQYIITDVAGREMEKGISKTNSISVNTQNLPNGVYNISIFTENNIMNTKKILIQK